MSHAICAQLGQTTEQLASHYQARFHQSLRRLNVLPPTITLRVTDTIPSVISVIQRLIDNGCAYSTDAGLLAPAVRARVCGHIMEQF